MRTECPEFLQNFRQLYQSESLLSAAIVTAFVTLERALGNLVDFRIFLDLLSFIYFLDLMSFLLPQGENISIWRD